MVTRYRAGDDPHLTCINNYRLTDYPNLCREGAFGRWTACAATQGVRRDSDIPAYDYCAFPTSA
jgi:hypothetical protein